MKRIYLALGFCCFLMSGCLVPSLRPFYTQETLVTEPNIVGNWSVDDMNWSFAASQDKTYNLTVVQKGDPGQFEVHLFKLADQLYMDLYPEDLPKDLPVADFYKFHLLPVHHLMQVEMKKETMECRFLDPDKVKDLLEAYPQLLRHEYLDDIAVITDSTEGIQNFLKTFKDYPALWHEDFFEMTPVPEEDPGQND